MPTRKQLNAKRDKIRAWFDRCDINLPDHRAALKKAAQMIFSYQTPDEQDTGETRWLNGKGFNGRDGGFGARIARWDGDITLKMANGARSMLRKYAAQLAGMALARGR